MTFDEKLQLWNAAGSWFSGLGTFAAVLVSLWLVRRGERVQLKTEAYAIAGDSVIVTATNLGDRAVTIHSADWRIGRGKQRRYFRHYASDTSPNNYPARVEHGETAIFSADAETWAKYIAREFINREHLLSTLAIEVHTSVGHTASRKAGESILDVIRQFTRNS